MANTTGAPDDWHLAYTAVLHDGAYTIGIAERGVSGWHPLREPPHYDTYQEAADEAAEWNRRCGLTPRQAAAIVLSSMDPL